MAKRSRAFEARYPGRCGLCDDDFEAGDGVCYFEDEICHVDCADDE